MAGGRSPPRCGRAVPRPVAPAHSIAWSMSRILRARSSICFRLETVSSSNFSGVRSRICVSARIADKGLAMSCRSFSSAARGSAVKEGSGRDREGGGRAGPGPPATSRAPKSRRRFRRWTAPLRFPPRRTALGHAKCRPQCGARRDEYQSVVRRNESEEGRERPGRALEKLGTEPVVLACSADRAGLRKDIRKRHLRNTRNPAGWG